MTDLEQEAAWRTEFEADGERAVLDTICHGPGIYPDPKRSCLDGAPWSRVAFEAAVNVSGTVMSTAC